MSAVAPAAIENVVLVLVVPCLLVVVYSPVMVNPEGVSTVTTYWRIKVAVIVSAAAIEAIEALVPAIVAVPPVDVQPTNP